MNLVSVGSVDVGARVVSTRASEPSTTHPSETDYYKGETWDVTR